MIRQPVCVRNRAGLFFIRIHAFPRFRLVLIGQALYARLWIQIDFCDQKIGRIRLCIAFFFLFHAFASLRLFFQHSMAEKQAKASGKRNPHLRCREE